MEKVDTPADKDVMFTKSCTKYKIVGLGVLVRKVCWQRDSTSARISESSSRHSCGVSCNSDGEHAHGYEMKKAFDNNKCLVYLYQQ